MKIKITISDPTSSGDTINKACEEFRELLERNITKLARLPINYAATNTCEAYKSLLSEADFEIIADSSK